MPAPLSTATAVKCLSQEFNRVTRVGYDGDYVDCNHSALNHSTMLPRFSRITVLSVIVKGSWIGLIRSKVFNECRLNENS